MVVVAARDSTGTRPETESPAPQGDGAANGAEG
jgi:hypothetical protein